VGQLPFSGSEVFRFALHQHEIKPITDPNEVMLRPRDTIVVIVGDVSRLHIIFGAGKLPAYLNAGGSILLATDGPTMIGQNDWAQRLGIEIMAVPLIADAKNCYQGQTECPFIVPRPRVNRDDPSPFQLMSGVDATGPNGVATSYPSPMAIQEGRGYLVKRLARYPNGTTPAGVRGPIDQRIDNFAVSLQPQFDNGGRMIAIADHGVFFNGMMGVEKDETAEKGFKFNNDNWGFSNRTIDWLQGGAEAPRKRCLFIEHGEIKDQFATEIEIRPPMPKLPPADALANGLLNSVANPLIDEAQKQDFFNRVLLNWLGFPVLLRIFLIVVTVAFVLAGLRWLTSGHRKREPAAIMTPLLQQNLLPRGGVLRQRTASQIESGNLYDAARRRVRQRFDVLGGQPGPSNKIPPVLLANDLRDGPVLMQSIRWLWLLGYGETTIAVPPTDWDRTNVLLERVTARAARGDWSFGQET
jgi:hypothetical protein